MAKTYADYQLKAAIEERNLKSKDESQSLEFKGRAIESVFSQQEEAYRLQKELLDKLINKDLEQAQLNSNQIIEILANAVKSIDENRKLLEKNSIELSEIKQRLNQLVDLANEIISVLKSKG
jgi:DNA primase large subunit